MVHPEVLLDRLSARLVQGLGESLLSLSVHGSWVAGDFHPGRSDLDLVALLPDDPGTTTLETLARIHERLAHEAPGWAGHVEVDYVSPAAVRDVLAGTGPPHTMVRISPGEPIHLTEASRHYLLNWRSAMDHDHVLVGASPRALLPHIAPNEVRRVVLDHLEHWPLWVDDMRTPGARAYAVLAVCRAAAMLETGGQPSKRAGAAYGLATMPRDAALIGWARDWWFAGGADDAPDRHEAVAEFTRRVAPAVAARHRPTS